jgi:lysophospholipase L1-like esterase
LEIFYLGTLSLENYKRLLQYFGLLFLIIHSVPIQANSLKDGGTIIFFGDSITELGVTKKGYITLINQAISKAYPRKNITLIGSGIAGNTVIDLHKRMQRDVLQQYPALVVVFTGVNDIWFAGRSVPKQQFSQQLAKIIWQIKRSGADVILVTPAVMGERHHGENRFDKALDEYAMITQSIGKKTQSRVINLRKLFINYLKRHNTKNLHMGVLTRDSVHFNAQGNRLLARELISNSRSNLY